MTTIELSTSMPTATASPESEIILIVMPEKYISTTASTRLRGMLTATMKVGLMLRRKKNRMTIASAPPMSRFCSTEPTTMWIYCP